MIDPLAEKYYHASPFAYVENNPIIGIDPDGRGCYQAVGDCFQHSSTMISARGAEYLVATHHNEPAANVVSYIDTQVNQGWSVRVHVDRIDAATGTSEGSNTGVHWVAISSRTTNLRTGQTTSFRFFEHGTKWLESGTSLNNRLNFRQGSLIGPTEYSDDFTYKVISVRRNR